MDVLVDTGAQVSLVRRGLFKEEFLQPSRRPVRLKVANGEIMGGGCELRAAAPRCSGLVAPSGTRGMGNPAAVKRF